MSGDLPPGQLVTTKFPIIGEREPEPFDASTWRLEVTGLVERPLALTWDEFTALDHEDRVMDIHCVTRWSRLGTAFRGVPLTRLLADAAPTAKARFVRFISGRGHDTSLPIALADDVLIADGLDGDSLPPAHGGPVRSVTEGRYFYKSVKWLRSIELMAEDRLGFWERTAGYHNGADPASEQRYVVRGVDRAHLKRLLDSRDLSGQDLLGADLQGLDLSGMRLTDARLRAVDLRGATLRGANLARANFSNADLRGADLREADLSGTDLDGADLRDADLRGATGEPCSLAATQFVSPQDGEGGARVSGLDWRSTPVAGMLAEQVEYLERAGARLADG